MSKSFKDKINEVTNKLKTGIKSVETNIEDSEEKIEAKLIEAADKVVDKVTEVVNELGITLDMIISSKNAKLNGYKMEVTENVFNLVTVSGWSKPGSGSTYDLTLDEVNMLGDIKYFFKNGHTSFNVWYIGKSGEIVAKIKR